MSLAERQLVSRAYARLQQLGEGGQQGQEEGQQERQEQAGAISSWSSRPAATNWRRAPSGALSS